MSFGAIWSDKTAVQGATMPPPGHREHQKFQNLVAAAQRHPPVITAVAHPCDEVSLKGALNEIQLTVHDAGTGFDPEKAMSGHGLGLTSMRERLNLVNGQLSIDSRSPRGTTIRARVPLSPDITSGRKFE